MAASRRRRRYGRTAEPGHARRSPEAALEEGWYLVYWRVVSADGHPVRSAFTFAVGPNPGPAPQFPIPSISETAATTDLVSARWAVFLTVMTAIGLFALRISIARPVVARVPGTSLRPLDVAFLAVSAAALVAIPIYLLLTTARFALRSVADVGALLPLVRDSSFGRGFLDLELCFALFTVAAALALWLDRPERPRRSVVELLACTGAFAAAAVTLLIPGDAGHPAQTSPRGLAVGLDWLHLASGSVWLGGLVGLVVLAVRLRRDDASRLLGRVPRFSPWRSAPWRCCSPPASGRPSSTCRRSPRSGRPRTARRSSPRPRCSPLHSPSRR